ncbi:hypothetical protein IBG34_23220 (plasmid) [Aeromonas media]|nr:hypothetical protein IBG34_23220 [Aeromonas media]
MTDLYAAVTETIIAQLETSLEKTGPLWLTQCSKPTNFQTGEAYKGSMFCCFGLPHSRRVTPPLIG